MRGVSTSTPERLREVAGRVALDGGQRVGVAGAGDDVVGPEGAYGGGEQQRTVGAPAEGDQHGAELAQPLLEGGEPQVEDVLVEPGRELVEAVEHDVGAGREQLLAGAAAGEHRDADDAGGQGALDVVDVVADVDRGALAAEHVGLADAPDRALEVVDVEAEVVDVALGVGRELAGHDHDRGRRGGVRPRAPRAHRAAPAPEGSSGRRRARGSGRSRARSPPAARCGASIRSSGGPRFGVSSAIGKSTSSSTPSASSVAANPGTVSIRVMSRSKPTTSDGGEADMWPA